MEECVGEQTLINATKGIIQFLHCIIYGNKKVKYSCNSPFASLEIQFIIQFSSKEEKVISRCEMLEYFTAFKKIYSWSVHTKSYL